VLTADDVPGELRSGLIHKDWPAFIPVGGRTSYLGDVVALVVADTRAQARAATSAVSVTYDVHEPLTDPAAALASDEDAVWTLPGNELSRSTYVRGDVDEALARSAHVARQTFQTQRIDHAFLEPESTLAVPTIGADGSTESLYVYSGGQGVWDDRNDIARMLDVSTDRSPSNSFRTAVHSAAKRTCRTRARPPSPPGCSVVR
jgi:CO/xanthine dehydrogenase Mo-binding subunit